MKYLIITISVFSFFVGTLGNLMSGEIIGKPQDFVPNKIVKNEFSPTPKEISTVAEFSGLMKVSISVGRGCLRSIRSNVYSTSCEYFLYLSEKLDDSVNRVNKISTHKLAAIASEHYRYNTSFSSYGNYLDIKKNINGRYKPKIKKPK